VAGFFFSRYRDYLGKSITYRKADVEPVYDMTLIAGEPAAAGGDTIE
jgi:hypothetical protein